MRDYGRVYSSFWTSSDIQCLSDDGRMLALYLLSGPHQTIAGICRLPEGYVCEDLQWTSQRVSKGLLELSRKGFVTVCEGTKWVWVRNFLRWNRPENPNQWKAARKVAEAIPDKCSFKAIFLGIFAEYEAGKEVEIPNPSETLPERLPEPLPTQDQDQEQEQEQKGSATVVAPPPSGLDTKAWETWIAYRLSVKKPLKPASVPAAQRALTKFGDSQSAVVEQSIANGWTGLFPLKDIPRPPNKIDPREWM